MRCVVLVFCLLINVVCVGANVHWATLEVANLGDIGAVHVFDDFGIVHFSVIVSQGAVADSYKLTFVDECFSVSGNYMNMVKSSLGNVIDTSTTRFLDESCYLVHYGLDGGDPVFGELELNVYEEVFLAYASSRDSIYYGWVGLAIDNEGTLYPYGAVDLDGGPMVVGGGAWEGNIPEPSGGMLLLIGAAVLGLRRRSCPYRRQLDFQARQKETNK